MYIKGGTVNVFFFRFAPVSGTYVHKGGTVNIFILVDAPVFGWVGANFGGKGANFDGKGAKICRQKGIYMLEWVKFLEGGTVKSFFFWRDHRRKVPPPRRGRPPRR